MRLPPKVTSRWGGGGEGTHAHRKWKGGLETLSRRDQLPEWVGGGKLPGWTILDVQLPGTWGKQMMGGGRGEEGRTLGDKGANRSGGGKGGGRGGRGRGQQKQGHICSMNKKEGKVHV